MTQSALDTQHRYADYLAGRAAHYLLIVKRDNPHHNDVPCRQFLAWDYGSACRREDLVHCRSTLLHHGPNLFAVDRLGDRRAAVAD
jgi:hypothetical protein